MRNFDRRANAEYEQALSIDPNLFPAYDGLLTITTRQKPLDAVKAVYDRARLHLPQSYLLAADYMLALEPRWLGNYGLMYQYANEMRAYVAENPRFYDLGGYVDADMADSAYRAGDYAESVTLYSKALRYGDYPTWLKWAAEAAISGKQYRVAYAYYNRYLLYKPQDSEARARFNQLAPICASPSPVCQGKEGFPWDGETLPANAGGR